MKTRILGTTDIALSELGFGGGAIGNLYRVVPREAAMATMEAAWDQGIRYFDTAPFYGHGLSERRIGDFLRDREGWVLSTKVGKLLAPVGRDLVPDHGFVDPLPFSIDFDYSRDAIHRSLDASFARLGLNRIDIVWVHDLEPASLGESYEHHMRRFLEGGLTALEDLKRQGVIGAFGLGVNSVAPCLRVLSHGRIDAILLAGRYTLLDRSAEADLLPLCQDRGIGLVIGGVFNSGILATGARQGAAFDYGPAPEHVVAKVRCLEEDAAKADIPLAAAALQFPLRRSEVASVLIGTGKPGSVTRNVDALAASVPERFWPGAEAHIL